MFYCHHLEQACRVQVAALSCNQELIMPSEAVCKKTNHDLLTFEKDLGQRDWLAWVKWIAK
jgi:ribulose-5-phosphate 4-epimerase/fuculose-1-phosphate aldolase